MEYITNIQIITGMGCLNWMFHDYHRMIARHKRPFILYKYIGGDRNTGTTRYEDGDYQDGVEVEGVWETITNEDLKRYPDLEVSGGDMKIITTPILMKNNTLNIKDKLYYQNRTFKIIKIVDDEYYGNFFRVFLKDEHFRI